MPADESAGLPLAARMVQSPDAVTRQKGYEILAGVRLKAGRRLLLEGLGDDHGEVRGAAARSLLSHPADIVAAELVAYIIENESALTEDFGQSIGQLREALEAPMTALLADEEESPDRQAAGAYCLGRMGGSDSADLLAERCWVRDPRLALTSVQALVALGDGAPLSHFKKLLRHPLREIRLEAVAALASFGSEETVPILYGVAIGRGELDVGVRRQAVYGLGAVGRPASVHALMRLMRESGTLQKDASASLRELTGLEWHGPRSWHDWYAEWSSNPVWPPVVGRTMGAEIELGEF